MKPRPILKKITDWFIDFLCTDQWRKMMALILACGLYFYLRPQETREITALICAEAAPSLLLRDTEPQKVTLKIKGSPEAVKETLNDTIKGSVRLDENTAIVNGQVSVKPEPENFSLRSGIKITGITPERLTLRVEPRIRKELKVRAELKRKLPPGYKISCTVVPDKVWVTGPGASIEPLKEVATEPVIVDLDTTFSRKVRLAQPGENLKTDPDSVTVTVEIQEAKENRTYSDLPVRYLFSPLHVKEYAARLSLPEPGSVTVILTGPPESFNLLGAEKITVCADLTGSNWQKAEDGRVPLTVHFEDGTPAAIRVREIRPPYIRVRTAPAPKNKQ